MLASLHALLLAALLAVPLALLVRRRLAFQLPGLQRRSTQLLDRLADHYSWLVLAVTAWLAFGVLLESLDLQHNIETAVLLSIVMGCVFIAPRYPLMGPMAYVLLSYTFGRGDTVTVTLMNLGATSWVAALAVLAALVWARRQHEPVRLPGGWLTWLAAVLFAWLAVTVVAAVLAGRPVAPDVTWRAARYAQAAALFFVAACCRPSLRDIRNLVLALAAALVIRQVFLTSYWLLEQNLAMLTVVTVPIALAAAFCRPFSRLQVPLALAGAYMTAMILFVQNRGAIVGLAAASLGLWPLARRRWLGLLLLVTLPAAAAYWAYDSGLLDRFRQVYADGRFLGTAAQRLEIWANGLRVARDHWLFGVGPGNFEFAITAQTEGRIFISAHNSFVELLVEAGGPAVLTYLAVFAAAAGRLARVARRHRLDWRRTVAAGLLGSFAAHLGAGSFLSNPSLVWTWILLGVAASLPAGGGVGHDAREQPAGD